MQNVEAFTPILVIVKDDQWNAYGPVTPRSQYLTELLTAIGGVNESVPEGRYDFNELDVNGQPTISLTPHLDLEF